MDALHVRRADIYPRVSTHIEDIIHMISVLIEKDYAYELEGDVYYSVEKFTCYGCLSGRSLDDMMAGARIEVDDRKHNPMDVIAGLRVSDPEELIISREEFADIELKLTEILSDLEWQVLNAYLDGKSYNEMSTDLHRHVKSIDNALQRVKRKLERFLESRKNHTDKESGKE